MSFPFNAEANYNFRALGGQQQITDQPLPGNPDGRNKVRPYPFFLFLSGVEGNSEQDPKLRRYFRAGKDFPVKEICMQNVDQKDYRHKNVYCFALPPDFKLRDLIYDNIRHWRVNPQELLGEKYKLVGLTVDPKQSANLRDPQGNLLTKGMIDEINASNPSLYPEVQRVTIDGEVVRATARDSSAVAAKPPPLLAGRAVSNAETSAVGTGDKDKAQAKARDVTCIYDPPDSLELVVLKDKTRFCRGKVFCKVGEQKIEDRAFCEQLAHLPRDVCPSATDCAYAEAVRDRQGRPVADEVLESAPKHTNARPDSGNGRGNGVNGGTGTGISN